MGGKVLFLEDAAVVRRQQRKKVIAAWVLLGTVIVSIVLVSNFAGIASSRTHTPRGRTFTSTSSAASRSMSQSMKAALKQCIRAVGDAPFFSPVLYHPRVKRLLQTMPGSRVLYGSEWDRKHPFDRFYGTDTSGFLFGEEFLTGHPAEEHGSPYAGVQPSIVRAVLPTLPHLERCTFIDLGCGKGRPMLLATEYPFRDIIGVELSPPLAAVAQKNAEHMARSYPERTRIRVVVGDATVFPIPEGDVVLFLYNSFDRELMQKVVENVESALKADSHRSIYVVYCNPASGECFDASPLLKRRYAKTHPYAPDELGYAPDTEDAVIIWQGGNAPAPTERTDARIVILKERWRATLQPA
jgi:SAM-dependent methyltransferase